MKHFVVLELYLFVLAMMFACQPSKEIVEPIETPSPALSAIDSLMWHHPDSAFAQLLKFMATPQAINLDKFNKHYCQMLISELLYKNDCKQSNRSDLQKAVFFFDSLCDRDAASHVDINNFFLDARVHYINGVGYYENDSLVEACREYLKALEVMEGHFEVKKLTGDKAKFMTFTYNRIGELFSEQFMMDPALECYESALVFCRIEPTSPECVPNTLYRIGKQYDKKNDIENARLYFEQAMEGMKSHDNLLYRDMVSSKALCDYQFGIGIEQVMGELRKEVAQAKTEEERLNRFLTIGAIYNGMGIYDSALFYFVPVFQNETDVVSKTRAAESIRVIYDSIGNREKADECMRFLAEHKKSEGETKALVSELEDLYKTYIYQKQENNAKKAREKIIQKTSGVFVPVVIGVALSVFIVVKLRSKKLLKKQYVEADRMLGKVEQQYMEELERLQMEAEQCLEEAKKKHQLKVEEMAKRHERELRNQQAQSEKEIEQTRKRHELELEMGRKVHDEEKKSLLFCLKNKEDEVKFLEEEQEHRQLMAGFKEKDFFNEKVCRDIINSICGLPLSARSQYGDYYYLALDETTGVLLAEAVAKHFPEFRTQMTVVFPKMNPKDLQMCYLYLLRLNNQQIAILQQRHNSTLYRHAELMQKAIKADIPLPEFVRILAYNHA